MKHRILLSLCENLENHHRGCITEYGSVCVCVDFTENHFAGVAQNMDKFACEFPSLYPQIITLRFCPQIIANLSFRFFCDIQRRRGARSAFRLRLVYNNNVEFSKLEIAILAEIFLNKVNSAVNS